MILYLFHFILFSQFFGVCLSFHLHRKQQRKRFNLVRHTSSGNIPKEYEKWRVGSEREKKTKERERGERERNISHGTAFHYLTLYFHIETFIHFITFEYTGLNFDPNILWTCWCILIMQHSGTCSHSTPLLDHSCCIVNWWYFAELHVRYGKAMKSFWPESASGWFIGSRGFPNNGTLENGSAMAGMLSLVPLVIARLVWQGKRCERTHETPAKFPMSRSQHITEN